MKNPFIKRVYVFISSLLIFALHIPFVFAKTKSLEKHTIAAKLISVTDNISIEKNNSIAVMYESLHLNELGLSDEAFKYAVKGYSYLKEKGRLFNDHIISIVDFTKPSYLKRLFVIDVEHGEILFNTYVAHGQGSGKEFANHFSNTPESFQSSLGFYLTSDTYNGKNGYSMHLTGIEKGINDKADERAIVMHGAPYVSEDFIRAQGYLGRSWGCPAVPEKLNKPIIEQIKNGSCLFIYSKNKTYLKHSKILNS